MGFASKPIAVTEHQERELEYVVAQIHTYMQLQSTFNDIIDVMVCFNYVLGIYCNYEEN